MPVKVTPPDAEAFFNQVEPQAPSDTDLNGHRPSFDPPKPNDAGGKVAIDVGCDHLPTLNSLSWEAVKQGNDPPVLFRYGNTVVRVARADNGGIWLQIVTPEIMRHHLSNWAHWHKYQVKLAKPPLDVIKDVLATADVPLPPLRRVVRVPTFAADGSLSLEPGYNVTSGVLYAPAEGFTALDVPDKIEGKHVDEANQLICGEVLVDFPFASTADRDNAVALYLLPFIRDMIDGPTPNHLAEASMPGSGKGKLVDALLLPSAGCDLGLITPPRDDDEWRKQITSALIAGKQIILIDNVIHRLDSSALAAAWTGNVWDDRILGQKEKANIPIRCVWVMTGNNIAVSTELARRCVRIRLTPATDRPEERDDFRHPDLLLWVADHRAELVRAGHILIKWWTQKGSPGPQKVKPLGSYERWTRVIGGIMESAGYTAFLGNYREFQNRADTERTSRALFCETWYEWSQADRGRERVTTADLIPIAEGVEGLPITGNTPKGLQTSLGRYLKANADVVVEYNEEIEQGKNRTRQFRIVADKVRAGKQEWIIEMVYEEVHEVLRE